MLRQVLVVFPHHPTLTLKRGGRGSSDEEVTSCTVNRPMDAQEQRCPRIAAKNLVLTFSLLMFQPMWNRNLRSKIIHIMDSKRQKVYVALVIRYDN